MVDMMLLRRFQEVLVLLRHCKAVVLCTVTRVLLVVARVGLLTVPCVFEVTRVLLVCCCGGLGLAYKL